MKAFTTGVFAGRFAELDLQRMLDVGEGGVVARAQLDDELVGDDAATFDVDIAVIVDFAQQTAAEFDGSDAGIGAA